MKHIGSLDELHPFILHLEGYISFDQYQDAIEQPEQLWLF
jgi:hypothetical protein